MDVRSQLHALCTLLPWKQSRYLWTDSRVNPKTRCSYYLWPLPGNEPCCLARLVRSPVTDGPGPHSQTLHNSHTCGSSRLRLEKDCRLGCAVLYGRNALQYRGSRLPPHYYSILEMEAIYSPGTSLNFYQITWRRFRKTVILTRMNLRIERAYGISET
jgi:hypothetical protein